MPVLIANNEWDRHVFMVGCYVLCVHMCFVVGVN